MIRNTGNGFMDDNGNSTKVPKVIQATQEHYKLAVHGVKSEERYKLVVHGVSGVETWVDTYEQYR